MFVLCVLYSKDKGRSQNNEDKETSTDEVQREDSLAGSMDICLLSGRGLCDVCGIEASRISQPWPALGCCATERRRSPAVTFSSHILVL